MQLQDFGVATQALIQSLEDEARHHATQRGAGWAILPASRIGGVEAVQSSIDEMRSAGMGVSVSAGERDRFIQLDRVRVARDAS